MRAYVTWAQRPRSFLWPPVSGAIVDDDSYNSNDTETNSKRVVLEMHGVGRDESFF